MVTAGNKEPQMKNYQATRYKSLSSNYRISFQIKKLLQAEWISIKISKTIYIKKKKNWLVTTMLTSSEVTRQIFAQIRQARDDIPSSNKLRVHPFLWTYLRFNWPGLMEPLVEAKIGQ